MSEQPSPDRSLHGRPYVDYYPMSGIPPRRGGYTVREPHGFEATPGTRWESTAAREGGDGLMQQQHHTSKVEEEAMESAAGGEGKGHDTEQKGDVGGEPTADKVVVEVTEEEQPGTEADVVQRAPMISGPDEAAANTVAVPRETEPQNQKGPVCIPPGDS
ncbi:hypothetical protein PG991_011617 [Apiospora marii]|uniref:Uncharacterized protein n=1 Tax=Apiospora marii TaxID=335849 RepID=A0ABR1RES3_9PEZI